MDSPLFGTLFVCGSMVVSVVGLVVVRRFVNLVWLKKHHEIASYFFLMIGTLYAVLIAFAIYVVWTQFQDAGAKLEAEANAVGDLSRMAAGLPEPQRAQVRDALLDYIHAVLDDEFPAMAEGRESPRTWAAMQRLMDVYTKAEVGNVKDQVFTTESLKHLNELSNFRRSRLFTSRGTVPQLLWYLLFGGGAVLVAFTYFFGHESVAWQGAMTAALAGTLSFSLYLIIAFNGPFDGSTRVSPTPYQVELQHVSARY
ncbi:MAG TPA: DUF4239 domain-containing protein [Verrucomicrobiae bacterium]|jgi:hypothetical protein|nr:DUF4239 domain-containing protein [Verrucomicrobiae bacterium]